MFLLAANKLLVDTQENLKILQEKVSTLTWQLNEREKNITQLTENMKGKNINTFIIVLVHDFMCNEYPLGLMSCIRDNGARLLSCQLTLSICYRF